MDITKARVPSIGAMDHKVFLIIFAFALLIAIITGVVLVVVVPKPTPKPTPPPTAKPTPAPTQTSAPTIPPTPPPTCPPGALGYPPFCATPIPSATCAPGMGGVYPNCLPTPTPTEIFPVTPLKTPGYIVFGATASLSSNTFTNNMCIDNMGIQGGHPSIYSGQPVYVWQCGSPPTANTQPNWNQIFWYNEATQQVVFYQQGYLLQNPSNTASQNTAGDLCLTAPTTLANPTASNMSRLTLTTCLAPAQAGFSNQQWQYKYANGGYGWFLSGTNWTIDNSGGGRSNGNPVTLYWSGCVCSSSSVAGCNNTQGGNCSYEQWQTTT